MNPEQASALRTLVAGRTTAALGTLHDGGPFVSMVPFAVTPDGAAFVVLVSGLAAHTRDMRADPRVSLLVAQAEGDGAPAQALARLTVVGEAHAAEPGSPEAAACSAAYLARFPDAARLLAMADFSFFAIRPKSARWVGGFAQAMNVDPATLARTLAAG